MAGEYDYEQEYYDYQDFYDYQPPAYDYEQEYYDYQDFYDYQPPAAAPAARGPDVIGNYSPSDPTQWVGYDGTMPDLGPEWATTGQWSPARPQSYFGAAENTDGLRFPDGTLVPPMPRPQFGGSGGFRSWDTRTGPGGSNTPSAWSTGGAPEARTARSTGGAMLNDMFARYNANMAEARRRAEADRAMALGRANQFGRYLKSADVANYRQMASRLMKNPFGPEFLAKSVDRQRESRMQQLAAAEANLKQHYANMGRTVPPLVLAYLRAQVAQHENSDLRNTQLDSAKLGFGADLDATQAYGQMVGQIGNLEGQANQAIYNVLANTNYIPSGQELAFLMQLAQQGNR